MYQVHKNRTPGVPYSINIGSLRGWDRLSWVGPVREISITGRSSVRPGPRGSKLTDRRPYSPVGSGPAREFSDWRTRSGPAWTVRS